MIKGIAPWAGMLGTALFVLSLTINGFLRSNYSPTRMYISELSIGAQGWIQIVSFILLGFSIVVFALGLKAVFPTGKASRAAPILFVIIGVCYVLSGPFVTDPAAMFDNQQTLHGILHGIFGAIVFSLSAAVCFVLWRCFRADENWKSLAHFALISGIGMTVLIVLMKLGQLQPGLLQTYAGLVQRGCLGLSYALVFAVSWRMRRLAKGTELCCKERR